MSQSSDSLQYSRKQMAIVLSCKHKVNSPTNSRTVCFWLFLKFKCKESYCDLFEESHHLLFTGLQILVDVC
jgi:hypothetical protein